MTRRTMHTIFIAKNNKLFDNFQDIKQFENFNMLDETAKETTTVNMVYENGKWVFNQAYLLN